MLREDSCSPLHQGLQAKECLQFSEDEDGVIVGSLDFGSEYLDDCPWLTSHTPQGVKEKQDKTPNNKVMRMTSPVVERRCAQSPMPERGRTAKQHHPERREKNQEQVTENKENIAVQERGAEKFLVPLPQTPASSKKNARVNKNVLTTPNDNVSTKTYASPKVGDSASKDQKKKKAEHVEPANLEIMAFSPERRSRSLDMAGTGDSGKKRRAGKMFGSLERGLDKVITMLTPSKRRGPREGPRKIKVQYNVTLTNQTNPDQVLNQILSALPEKNVDFTQKGYTLKCQTWGDYGKVTMAFELEVCLLQKLDVVGVRRQRLKGDAWVYKHLVEDILSTSSI